MYYKNQIAHEGCHDSLNELIDISVKANLVD